MKKLSSENEEKTKLTGGFGGFFDQMSDSDIDILSDDSDQVEDGILCCCKPHLIHNESMKY